MVKKFLKRVGLAFFENYRENNTEILLRLYATFSYISDVVHKRGWREPYAAWKNSQTQQELIELVGEDFLEQLKAMSYDTFHEVYSQIAYLKLPDFYSTVIPAGTLAQEETVFAVLDEMAAHDPNFSEAKQAVSIVEAREYYDASEDPKHFCTYLADFFKMGVEYGDRAFDLFCAVNMYPFDALRRVDSHALAAIELLNSWNSSKQYILDKYIETREILLHGDWVGRRNLKDYMNPSHYARAAKGHMPRIDIGIEAELNEAFTHIAQVKKPSDFLVALEPHSERDDKLECGIVRTRFLARCTENDQILIINPSALFIQLWPKKLLSRTTFCVLSDRQVLLLQEELHEPKIIDHLDLHCSKELDATKILFFVHYANMPVQELEMIKHDSAIFRKPGTETMLLLPLEKLEADKQLRKSIADIFEICQLDMLPREVSSFEPRRKVLLLGVHTSKTDTFKAFVSRYEWIEVAYKTKYLGRQKDNKHTALTAEQFIDLKAAPGAVERTFHALMRDLEAIAEAVTIMKVRKDPYCVPFSPEINIWFKYSMVTLKSGPKIKIEASVYTYPNSKQLKRNKFPRGRDISSSHRPKNVSSLDEAVAWAITVAPFNAKIHHAVCGAFQAGRKPMPAKIGGRMSPLLEDPISLRTIWYVGIDLAEIRSDDSAIQYEMCLMLSAVGELRAGEATADDFTAEMQKFFANQACNADMQRRYWAILDQIMDHAVKKCYCDTNPVKNFVNDVRNSRTRASDVRDNMVKKTFSWSEDQRLYQFLLDCVQKDPAYLGVLLRFLTGLELNVVCGLRWGDLHKIDGFDIYQLWVMRQAQNTGEICVGFERLEDYRRLPILAVLASILLTRQKNILDKFNWKKSDIKNVHICLTDDQLADDRNQVPSPKKLSDLSRRVVKDVLQIEDNFIVLPDTERGTKETNLAAYHGDIFKSNLKYVCQYACGYMQAEEEYYFGLQQKTTYGKHYCDFRNDIAQAKMYYKLERWMDRLVKVEVPQAPLTRTAGCVEWTEQRKIGLRTWAILNLTASDDVAVKVSAESCCGLTGHIDLLASTPPQEDRTDEK